MDLKFKIHCNFLRETTIRRTLISSQIIAVSSSDEYLRYDDPLKSGVCNGTKI